jgi:CBS domain-containing protein
MAKVYELVKDRETFSVNADQTVLEAAHYMAEKNIGAVAVLRNNELVGIFSERDIMGRVVAAAKDPAKTRVAEVMTANPVVADIGDSLENCMVLMKQHGFRHLPICEGKQIRGLISLRDILLRDLTEKDNEVRMMRAYIQATPGGE